MSIQRPAGRSTVSRITRTVPPGRSVAVRGYCSAAPLSVLRLKLKVQLRHTLQARRLKLRGGVAHELLNLRSVQRPFRFVLYSKHAQASPHEEKIRLAVREPAGIRLELRPLCRD